MTILLNKTFPYIRLHISNFKVIGNVYYLHIKGTVLKIVAIKMVANYFNEKHKRVISNLVCGVIKFHFYIGISVFTCIS
jgi:hypothetical protein